MRGLWGALARFLAGVLAVVFVVAFPISVAAYDVGQVVFSQERMGEVLMRSFDEAGGFRRLAMNAIAGEWQDPAATPEKTGLDLTTALSFLTQQERDRLAERILPADWVEAQMRSVLAQLYAWIDDDRARPDIRVDMRRVKEGLRQGAADEFVDVVVASWPPCTLEQVTQMAGRLIGLVEGFPFCEPPEPLRAGVVGIAGEAIKLSLYALPDQLSISGERQPAQATPEVMRVKENVRLVRALSQWGWLIPLAVLLLILTLAIRSWRGLAWGWGLPLIVGGVLILGAALLVRTGAETVVGGITAGQGLPPILAGVFRTVAQTGVSMALAEVGLHGVMALGVGVVLFATAWLLAGRADRRLSPAGARSAIRTRIIPQEPPVDDRDRPAGMFR
ncbi:MAG TPA: hypothetical protein VLD63_02940 [Anaerolineales bacterium]|nr:hypothetical protein [Anaerolineales bacterium]